MQATGCWSSRIPVSLLCQKLYLQLARKYFLYWKNSSGFLMGIDEKSFLHRIVLNQTCWTSSLARALFLFLNLKKKKDDSIHRGQNISRLQKPFCEIPVFKSWTEKVQILALQKVIEGHLIPLSHRKPTIYSLVIKTACVIIETMEGQFKLKILWLGVILNLFNNL